MAMPRLFEKAAYIYAHVEVIASNKFFVRTTSDRIIQNYCRQLMREASEAANKRIREDREKDNN